MNRLVALFWSSVIRFGCPRHVLHTLEDDWANGKIRCVHCGKEDW